MSQRFILGIGSGRCGTLSLAHVFDAQPGTRAMHENPPLLPWIPTPGRPVMEQRFVRWRRKFKDAEVVADVASFYLPYLEDALRQEPELRVVCLLPYHAGSRLSLLSDAGQLPVPANPRANRLKNPCPRAGCGRSARPVR